MNWLIISVGTALVAALMAALIGPFFIDWTTYRTTIEAHASRVLGAQVSVDGDLDIRFLPRPHMRLTDVAVGDPANPLMQASAVEFDVDLAPLLSRDVRVLDLMLSDAVVFARLDQEGALRVATPHQSVSDAAFFSWNKVEVEQLTLDNGSLILVDERSRTEHQVSNIQMTASARSLSGPFSAQATLRVSGVDASVRLAAGAVDAEKRMALSFDFAPAQLPMTANFDGTVSADPKQLSLTGAVTMRGTGPIPWLVTAQTVGDSETLLFPELTFAYGSDEPGLELTGSARYALTGTDPFELDLGTRQINLDRLLARLSVPNPDGTPATPSSPRDSIAILTQYFAPVAGAFAGEHLFNTPLTLRLDVEMAVLGGALIRPLVLTARREDDVVTLENLEVVLPGDVSLQVTGEITTDQGGPHLDGALVMTAQQPGIFTRWFTGSSGQPLPSDTMIVEADAVLSNGRYLFPDISMRFGDSAARGELGFISGHRTGQRGNVDVSLTAPKVDAADVQRLIALAGEITSGRPADLPDVQLALDITRLRVGELDGASLLMSALFREDTLMLNTLELSALAGASIRAQGTLGAIFDAPAGTLDAAVSVPDGAPLAVALRRLAPQSAAAQAVASRLPDLAPANLSVQLSGASNGSHEEALRVSVEGDLAGTALSLSASGAMLDPDWAHKPLSLQLDAAHEDGYQMLAQLGFSPPSSGTERAELSLSLDGTLASGAPLSASAQAFGGSGSFDGVAQFDDGLSADGAARWDIPSLAKLLPSLGLPQLATGPMTGATDLSLATGSVSMRGVRGTFDGVTYAGDVALDDDALSGQIDLSDVSLAGLAAPVLGRVGDDRFRRADGWSSAPFSIATPLGIDVAVRVRTPSISLGDLTLRNASFKLEQSASQVALTNLAGELAGGSVEGDLGIGRLGSQVSVNGLIEISAMALSDIVWDGDGVPIADGRLSLSTAFQGTGDSVAALIQSVTGTGSMTLQNVTAQRMDTGSIDLGQFVASSDPTSLEADLAALLASQLDSGPLQIDQVSTPLDMIAGTMRIPDVVFDSPNARTVASGTFDFASWQMRSGWDISPGGSGFATPAFEVSFAGPLGAPSRTVDASALAAWMALRQVERQLQEVEAQNQELEAQILREDGNLSDDFSLDAEEQTSEDEEPPLAPPDAVPPDQAAPSNRSDVTTGEEPQTDTTQNTVTQPINVDARRDDAEIARPTGAGFGAQLQLLDAALGELNARLARQRSLRDEALSRLETGSQR
ncbi:MAG: AsmA family protein [Pseudomonadota bacterium]